MELSYLLLVFPYAFTLIVETHAVLNCNFDDDACDWTLVEDGFFSPLFKAEHQICGFHGDVTQCQRKLIFYHDTTWMVMKRINISDHVLETSQRLFKYDFNVSQLQHTISKGLEEIDMTLVFAHNVYWFLRSRLSNVTYSAWSTSYIISDEISFSYQPSCLHYKYFLTGLTSMVISYQTNFDNIFDAIPIKSHTTEGKREKFTNSSVNLPIVAKFKIIFRVIFNHTVFSTATLDSIDVVSGRCSDPCPINKFSCTSEECVEPDLLCDGTSDCMDGSDELFCYDDTKKAVCYISDEEQKATNETISRVIEDTANSGEESVSGQHFSRNALCASECIGKIKTPENWGNVQNGSSTNFPIWSDEIERKECGTEIANRSLCTFFCPPTCQCFDKNYMVLHRSCSVILQVVVIYNVSCDVLDVDNFDIRHIFSLYISNSVIGQLDINPKKNKIMLHDIHIKNTILDNIFINSLSDKLLYLQNIILENCTIGLRIDLNALKGSKFYSIYRSPNMSAFHLHSMTTTINTQSVTATANFPDDIYLDIEVKGMTNLSGCGLRNLVPLKSSVVDVSHNILPYYYHWTGQVQVLYIQHNLLPTMITSGFPFLNEYDILKVLNISYNRITELKHGDLFCRQLLYLNLKGNMIHTIEADAFFKTTKLVFLDLSGNKLSLISSGTFLPLEFLQELYIQENYFQVFDGMFDGLISLKLMQVEFFSICCAKPKSIYDPQCIAPVNGISSCENLIAVPVLNVAIWYIASLATFGNFIVLLYYVHNFMSMSSQTYAVFIMNLSLADFLMGVYLYIVAITNLIYTGRYGLSDYTWRHSAACTVTGIIATLSSEASALTVFLITLDRFVAVKYPFSSSKVNIKTAFILSIAVWVFSLILSLIPLFPFPVFKHFYAQSGICISLPLSVIRMSGWEYSMVIFVGFNFLLFLGILVGQINIFVEVVRSGAAVRSSRTKQREITLAVSVLGVVLTDMCCWIPIGTIGMLTFLGVDVPSDLYAWIIVVVLPINSALNPLLYTLTAVIRRKKEKETDMILQLKQQLVYWKAKRGYPSDAKVCEL